MGKLVANFFISLDGVVESPDKWHFPYFDDEMGAAVEAGVQNAGAFMMGRTLYEEWSQYWPAHADDDFGTFINDARKYVVSSSLDKADWNNTTVVPGDPDRIREVKDSTEGDVAMSGSATLVRWLLARELLDELQLLVHPIAVGSGRRLFEDTPTHPLELLSSKTFGTGVLHLVYAPAVGG